MTEFLFTCFAQILKCKAFLDVALSLTVAQMLFDLYVYVALCRIFDSPGLLFFLILTVWSIMSLLNVGIAYSA
jgi:hypothetical protein